MNKLGRQIKCQKVDAELREAATRARSEAIRNFKQKDASEKQQRQAGHTEHHREETK